MSAPNITNLVNDGTGDSVTLTLTFDPADVGTIVVYRRTVDTSWSTKVVTPPDASVQVDSLDDGYLYEFAAVAVDVSGDFSLPSVTRRVTCTSSDLPHSRQIEKDVLATIGSISTSGGAFDDMDRVWRFSFPVDVTLQKGFYAIVSFSNVDHEQLAQRGLDAIDDCRITVTIILGVDGRDGSEDWIPDKAHQALAAVKMALMDDPSRSSLAIDTVHTSDILTPEIDRLADAVCACTFEITYRTLRKNPYKIGI